MRTSYKFCIKPLFLFRRKVTYDWFMIITGKIDFLVVGWMNLLKVNLQTV